MARHFNIAGPCRPDWHYMIPAERRLPGARPLVEEGLYFVVHAPRQTGKTTTLSALASDLTAEGRYAALHVTCEEASVAGDDYGAAMRAILGEIRRQGLRQLPVELRPPPFPEAVNEQLLGAALGAWAAVCPRPLVLILDEIDALVGLSLISVLRQLRAGFPDRPERFPWSVILCGLRDVRDYKVAAGGDGGQLGTSSPFNIKVASLRVGDFSPPEVRELYDQHTKETGQAFAEEALVRAWEVTRGQPWLTNALARKIVQEIVPSRAEAVTVDHVEAAKERLILERATHLDSLAARLSEGRVRRVIEPLIAGLAVSADATYNDDVSYVRDLGLVAQDRPLRVANPIYREVIARALGSAAEDMVVAEPRAFVLSDGRLAWKRLLRAFGRFWREHGASLATRMPYPEAGPQLVFMAFLQRIVNGGGYVDREYGVGRGRVDLLVRFPYRKRSGEGGVQRRAVELKVWREGRESPVEKGLAQLDEYLAGLGLNRGTLLIFDTRTGHRQRGRTKVEDRTTQSGRRVRVMWA